MKSRLNRWINLVGLYLLSSEILVGQESLASEQWLKAFALQPGDTIAIVAPSSPVNGEQVRAYANRLEQSGFQVLVPESIERSDGYLAGTDSERVEELNRAIRDPNVKAIFPARGGYGLTRILDQLDYDSLRKNPKIITGYSDITALHLAIAKKCRLITFHSPVPMSNLWKGDEPDLLFANSMFRRSIFDSEYPRSLKNFSISSPHDRPARTMVGGVSRGRLVGGNLTLISALMGTPFEIDTRDSILFLEDVDEAPYRIDRMLSQLRLAGVLRKSSGIILGDFSHDNGASKVEMERVLQDYFANSTVPVVWNFPLGHITANATLPIGVMAELDANQCMLRLLENPLQLRSSE